MAACFSVAHVWLTTLATRIEGASHPSDKVASHYPNLLQRVDGYSSDVENILVIRHVGTGVRVVKPVQDGR
jgi:hypothetical protein